jgi:two-component system, OmpR family, KDP operon response regulator KdpE
MAGSWNLRQLFANKASERWRNAEQRVSSAQIMEAGDFRVEVAERVVTLPGEELTLTAEEFDVLLYLIGHPQRCVTPRTVLATSWTSDGLHQTEFLKALLSLRKKLDAVAAGNQYLRTEPWVIYRFDPRSSFAV